MADLNINGVPAASLSFYIDNTDPLRDLPGLRYSAVDLYGRWGGLVAARPTIAAATVQLAGRIVTTANTVAARVAAEDVLRDALLNSGGLTLTLDDGTTPVRERDGYTVALDIQPLGHPMLAVASQVRWSLYCPDPLWRATEGAIVSVPATGTRYSLALGTAPASPILRVMGSATNPVVTIRDSGGTAQVTLTFTASLTSSEYLDVNCETGVLTKYSSGAASNGVSLLTSGTFPFALDPAWADWGNSRWPTVETSAGQAELLYVKRYL